MANNIFDDISMEELNEMLNNLPNDFDSEKKIEKRIQKKIMHRIGMSEKNTEKRALIKRIANIAAVIAVVIGIVALGESGIVSAYWNKIWFVPGNFLRDEYALPWNADHRPTSSDFQEPVETEETSIPLTIEETVTASNEIATVSLYNAFTTSNAVKIVQKTHPNGTVVWDREELENFTHYNGITLNFEIKLANDAKDDFSAYYDKLLKEYEGKNEDPAFDLSDALHSLGDSFEYCVDGKYVDRAENLDVDGMNTFHMSIDNTEFGLKHITIVMQDVEKFNTRDTHTVTLKHEFFGEFEFKIKLKEAELLGFGEEHTALSVVNNGLPITAAKYETEIDGEKFVAVTTQVDTTMLGNGYTARATDYTDEKGNEHKVAFEKADGTYIYPVKYENETYYFEADKISDGDDFIIPAINISGHDFSVDGLAVPIPNKVGKTENANVSINTQFGNIEINKVELVENYSYGDTKTEGKGLLLNVKWKEHDAGKTLFDTFWAMRMNPTTDNGSVLNDGTNQTVRAGEHNDITAPYLIMLQDTDTDEILIDNWNFTHFVLDSYRFDF